MKIPFISVPQMELFWKGEPFPHLKIHNFLPPELFRKLREESKSWQSSNALNAQNHDDSKQEKGKTTYGIENANPLQKYVAEMLSSMEWITELRNLIGISPTPLLKLPFKHDLQYFHHNISGAYLGPHLDTGNLKEYYHVLNCLYAAHEHWPYEYGGYTALYDREGKKVKFLSHPEPNSLFIFLHDSYGWHGMTEVTCPKDMLRETIFMSYFANKVQLQQLKSVAKFHGRTFDKWPHWAVFHPKPGKKFVEYSKAWVHYKFNKVFNKVV